MNHGWNEIIEGAECYYESKFNMSKIFTQLLDCNDIFSRDIQAKRISGNDKYLCSSKMRTTAKI